MYYLPSKLIGTLFILFLGVWHLSGCSSTPGVTDFDAPVYPPAPEQPRFIFERTLMGSSDVEVLSKQDRFKALATGQTISERRLIKPYGVASYKGRIYVTDTVQRSVTLFDIPGKKFVQFGNKGPGILSKPIGIAVSSLGNVFVADNAARRIMVYDLNGNYLRYFGGKEELDRPSGVAVSPDGTYVYVVDTGGIESDAHNLVIYDGKTGELIKKVGKRGSEEGNFNLPTMAAVDSKGRVYVLDSGNFRVQRFTAEGDFEMAFGRVGNRFGHFSRPKGIAVDKDDNVYVVDSSFANFQIFNESGELLLFIGERSFSNEPGKFSLPADIHTDEDGRIYVVDQFFSKIDVFRPYGMTKEEGYAGIKPIENKKD